MLIIKRKHGQKITLTQDSQVTVLEIKPDYVRLGISAPNSVSVYRDEVYERVHLDTIDGRIQANE